METSTISIIATAAVIAIIIVFTVNGYRKGILRILVSTFALLISVLAASLLTKPVSALLRESSFVGENIESNIKEYIDSRISSLFSEEDQKIINGVGNGTLPDAQEVIDLLNGSDFIEGLVIPDFLKENIISNNTAEEYAELGVSTFSEYITARIVNIVINALTFLLLMIVISLLLRILSRVLSLIGKIPIIRGINRLLGAVLGFAEGVIIIWLLYLILMIFSGSEFGTSAMEVIRSSRILSLLYDNNILANALKSIFKL